MSGEGEGGLAGGGVPHPGCAIAAGGGQAGAVGGPRARVHPGGVSGEGEGGLAGGGVPHPGRAIAAGGGEEIGRASCRERV